MTYARLRDIDKQRITFHITSLTEEIEKTDARIHELIQSLSASDDVDEIYAKIRRLQKVREIMLEQRREMEEVLRRPS